MYGSNAYSGVVNIITDAKRELKLTAASLNGKEIYFSDYFSAGDWKLGGSIEAYRDNGDTFNDVFDINTLQSTTQDPRQVEQVSFSASDGISQIKMQYLGSTRNDYYLFRRLRDGVTEIDLKHWMLYGSHQLVENQNWSVSLSGGYQTAARKSITALQPGGETPFENADFLFGENLRYDSGNFSADASYHASPEVTHSFGAYFSVSHVPEAYLRSNYNLFSELSYLGEVITLNREDQRVVLNKDRRIAGAYFQSQWQASQELSLTAGARYDSYNDVDNALMPRFSSIYQWSPSQYSKLIYGKAYRAPSLGDLYDLESGLTVGNRDLNASEVTSVELVHSWQHGKHAIDTTFFENEHVDLIGFRTDASGNQFLDNVAGNKVRGVELEWTWMPARQWQFKSALTHLFNNQTDLGVSLDLPASEQIAPRTYMNYALRYAGEQWSFSFSENWRGRVDALQNNDSLLLVNSVLSYNWSEELNLSLNLRNLSDEDYATSSYISLGSDENGQNVQQYPARGRQILLQLAYQFSR